VRTRYVVLSDVHANLPALEAVLESAGRYRPDGYLNLGDAVGYGPFPNECVQRLAAVGAVSVLGNHELIALGRLSDERCSPAARDSLRWTTDQLTPETRDVLGRHPLGRQVDRLYLAHGSPRDPQEYVRSGEAAADHLRWLGREVPDARLLLLGHTHAQWAWRAGHGTVLHQRPGVVDLPPGERFLLNPGSVGQSRDTRAEARFAVLELGPDGGGQVTFHSIRYDVSAVRAALRHRGLPVDSFHSRPRRRSPARSVARRILSVRRRQTRG
jgi:predicted phosphodiesterase